jgi:hypothetical protein
MPTVLKIDGFRFFFYSNEGNEPKHIHVKKGDFEGKVWLEPEIQIAWIDGFSRKDEKKIVELLNSNYEELIKKWDEYFAK